MKRIPQVGDYIKTVDKRFRNGPWRGRIVEQPYLNTGQYKIEWSYTGGGYTDILTWVWNADIEVVRRPKSVE